MFVGGVVTPMIGMAALAYFDGCDPVKGCPKLLKHENRWSQYFIPPQ